MRRTVSIGTRWTFRYVAVMMVAVSLLGLYLYDRIELALRHDAELILELELSELLEELSRHRNESPEQVAHMVDPEFASARSDLEISFQIFGPDGTVRYGRGTLHDHRVSVPPGLATGNPKRLFRELDLGDEDPHWVLAASAGEDGFVQVGIGAGIFLHNARRVRGTLLASLPLALVMAGGVGLLLARGSLRPVHGIVAAARRITTENLDENIPTTSSGDEFDQIAEAFNGMLERIRSSVETLRRFSIDAAHQLRSPLTALRSRLEVTLDAGGMPPPVQTLLQEVLGDVARLAETVDAMLRLSSSETGLGARSREAVDVESIVGSVVEFFEPVVEQTGSSLYFESEGPCWVAGDANWLRQLFANLVENALHHGRAGAPIELRLAREGSWATVSVRDRGDGIPATDFERIFEQFQRCHSDRARPGLGLGLTIARRIATGHGGRIEVASALGRGSTFTVRFPLCAAPAEPSCHSHAA